AILSHSLCSWPGFETEVFWSSSATAIPQRLPLVRGPARYRAIGKTISLDGQNTTARRASPVRGRSRYRAVQEGAEEAVPNVEILPEIVAKAGMVQVVVGHRVEVFEQPMLL